MAATLLLLSYADALVPNGSMATAIFRFLPSSPFGLAALEEPNAPKRRRHYNSSLYDEILVETLDQPVPENHWTPLVIFLFLVAMLIGVILAFLCVLCCMRYLRPQVQYRAMKEINSYDVDDEGMREATFRARMNPVETGTQTSSRNDIQKWSFISKPDEAELQRAFQIKFQDKEMRRKREEEEEQKRLRLLQLEEEAKKAKEEAKLRSEEYERKLRDVEVMSKELLDIRSGMKRKRARGRRDTSLQNSSGGSQWQQLEQLDQQQQEHIVQDEAHGSSSQMRLDLQFKQDSKGKSKCSMQAYVDPAIDGSVTVDTPNDGPPPDIDMTPRTNAFELRHEDNFRKETYDVSDIREQARRKNTDMRASPSSSFVFQDVNEFERLAAPGFSRTQNNQIQQQQRRLVSSDESSMGSGHQSSNKGSQALHDDIERTRAQ
ncbi:uncharacterized protein LOC135385904 [Ornithodoros turicata]|uniref:uncharacterized protein LOC135385904 n=1 Tax=Ornithodoros turicata TaxID=34597 RepID=UPI00313A1D1B